MVSAGHIYSGLMDMMGDAELIFVIGHEMGYVIKKNVKKKIIIAYAGRAVRKVIASYGLNLAKSKRVEYPGSSGKCHFIVVALLAV